MKNRLVDKEVPLYEKIESEMCLLALSGESC